MTWASFLVTHKSKKAEGWGDTDQLTFDVPYDLGIKVGDVFEADGVKYKALSVTDVGDRKENLLIQGEENGKSQKGGTPVNTGEGSSDS